MVQSEVDININKVPRLYNYILIFCGLVIQVTLLEKITLLKLIISRRKDSEGVETTKIVLSPDKFPDVPFKRCLRFLYTGIVELNKESEMLDETLTVARLFNLPELALVCENAKKGDEFLNPSIGTWVNDRNGSVAKKLFLNHSLFSDVSFSVEGERVAAHKVVLCCRCDVMSAMLSGGFMESRSNEVNPCH